MVCAQDGSSKTAAILISDSPISVETGGKRFVVIVIIGTVKLYIFTSYVTYVGVVGRDPSAGGREHPSEAECRHGVGICIITRLELGSHHKYGLG